jgi:hypothetical protein
MGRSKENSGGVEHDAESAAAKVQRQTDEANAQTATDVKEAKEADIEKDTGERTPANVIEKGTESTDRHAPETAGTLAGDLNAGEGNELNTNRSIDDPSADTASSRTQKGPEQPHITADMVEEAERTEGPIDIAMVGDQDVEDVQDRADAEIGNLMADPQDPTKVLRTGDGVPAYAEPGSYAAAMQGVQQDASGHFESVAHTRSPASGTRV